MRHAEQLPATEGTGGHESGGWEAGEDQREARVGMEATLRPSQSSSSMVTVLGTRQKRLVGSVEPSHWNQLGGGPRRVSPALGTHRHLLDVAVSAQSRAITLCFSSNRHNFD